MRNFKRSSETLKKASHLVSLRMTKEYNGTKEEFVYPMLGRSRMQYFEKLMILHTPHI
jgi:hypothetical protein